MSPSVRAKKLFLGVRDQDNYDRRQFSILTTLTDGNELFLNQYAKMFTEDEIGNFDVRKQGTTGILEFIPFDLRENKYSFSFISYDTKQTIFDSDSFDFGNTVSIATTNVTSVGSTATVFNIPSDITSGKLLIETTSEDEANYEYNELNFVSTNSDVHFSEFGKITISDEYPSGIGTYGITSEGDVTFTPGISTSTRTNGIGVSIAGTAFNAVAQQNLRYANVEPKLKLMIKSKAQMIKVMSQCEGADTLTREQKFQVFVNVCDNMLKDGRITKANHTRWTEIW